MTPIDLARLIAAGVPPTQARLFVEPLAEACARFGINTPARIAAFIGQCRVESADFTRLEEGLYYTTPARVAAIFRSAFDLDGDRVIEVDEIEFAKRYTRNPKALANRAYAGKLGNGDEASGDGWRYRGRGIKQLTGRANYADAASELGRPYVEQPDLVATPRDACLTAAWFFQRAKGNLLADAGQWSAITRAVNGPAMLQADLRQRYTEDALQALVG